MDALTKRVEPATIPTAEIVVPIYRGGDYQRRLDQVKVDRIVKEFDPLLLGVLQVAWIDGHYWVWDGQHRLVALRALKVPAVHCVVAYGYTYGELAYAFATQGDIRYRVGPSDKFRGMLAAETPEYVAAMAIIERHGLRLDMSRTGGGTTSALRCHGSISAILTRDHGLSLLDKTLGVLVAGGYGPRFEGDTLSGVALFIYKYREGAPTPSHSQRYFEETLTALLAEWPERALQREARSFTADMGGTLPQRICVTLRHLYNRRVRTYKLVVKEAA